jgi:hypothetical protein
MAPQTDPVGAAPAASLYGGRALADWVRRGGRPRRPAPAHALRLRWHAYWFEHNWQAQSRRLGALALPENPVFILGLWRSGTTALHELLAACTGWVTPRTWQCFNPSTCFLSAAPAAHTVQRPMDQGRIDTHGPQEDEFALLLLGEPSIYRAFIDPRRLQECAEQQWQQQERPDTLPRWQDFIRGVASGNPGNRVLIKSPNHTFRLPLLRASFPGARFIWIGRHTGEVLQSNLKMWRMMMATYALWPCPDGTLERFLQDVVRAGTAVLARCLDDVSRDQLLWVDFEQLHAQPRQVLERVLEFLAPEAATALPAAAAGVEQALGRISVHPGARAALPDQERVREFERVMAAARQRFGAPPLTAARR